MSSIQQVALVLSFVTGAVAAPMPDLNPQEAVPLVDVCWDKDGDYLPDLEGHVVTVTGIVTVGSQVFHTKRLQGFIQDGTAGIELFSNSPDARLHAGDLVLARGRLTNHKGQTQLLLGDHRVTRRAVGVPEPVTISLQPGVLEKHEGQLAIVRGKVVGKRRNMGGELLLLEEDLVTEPEEPNGVIVFVHNTRATPLSLERYSVGDSIEVRGIISQYDYSPPYNEGYEILPRDADDIRATGITRQVYRRVIAIGAPILAITLAWLVGLRLQVRLQTRRRTSAERRLAEEREQHAVALRSIGEGVIATDTTGTVTLLNPRAESLTGWPSGGAIGRPLADIFQLTGGRSIVDSESLFHRVLDEGTILTLPARTTLTSGSNRTFPIACTAAPIQTTEGGHRGIVVVFDDHTERYRIDSELEKASRLESVGLLAGGIAHDFNNILTAIAGSLSLVRMAVRDGEPFEEELAVAERATIEASSLTKQLLTFARGGQPIKQPTMLGELLTEATSFALRGSSVRSEMMVKEDLWVVDADGGQIRQVVYNIVINAQEAMPDGGYITVSAFNREVTPDEAPKIGPLAPGKYVCIEFTDHGDGIPPEHVQKVFDPYFTTKKRGSGLGLTTTYSIVKSHGGHVVVDSALGKGTTFLVYLPATGNEVPKTALRPFAHPTVSGRVLVMDDDKVLRSTTSRILKKFGYDVDAVPDGQAAIDACAAAQQDNNPYQLAILDLTIPDGMGGEEAVAQIGEIAPQTKTIVSSGYSTSPVMADFKDFGFDGMVCKPYTADDLIKAIRAV